MQIRYRNTTLHLEDLPMDVGYASERVSLSDGTKSFTAGGHTGFTQLLISTPFIDEEFLIQMREIDTLLALNALQGISKTIVVANAGHTDPRMEGWMFGIDSDEAFGDYYGIRLAPGELGGEFAKALFIISKDGALFHSEIVPDLHGPFSLEKVLNKIAAAQNCYTGKGCHG